MYACMSLKYMYHYAHWSVYFCATQRWLYVCMNGRVFRCTHGVNMSERKNDTGMRPLGSVIAIWGNVIVRCFAWLACWCIASLPVGPFYGWLCLLFSCLLPSFARLARCACLVVLACLVGCAVLFVLFLQCFVLFCSVMFRLVLYCPLLPCKICNVVYCNALYGIDIVLYDSVLVCSFYFIIYIYIFFFRCFFGCLLAFCPCLLLCFLAFIPSWLFSFLRCLALQNQKGTDP